MPRCILASDQKQACARGAFARYFIFYDSQTALDSFFEQFFSPNLLQKVYARENVPPTKSELDFSKRIRLPPVVRITSPTAGYEPNSDISRIVVQATDKGGGVSDIGLYQNGKLLNEVSRQLVQDSKSSILVFEVTLLPGVNVFRATAFNTDRTEAIPHEIKIERKAIVASANLYILAVGINVYTNARYNLNYGKPQAFADAIDLRGKRIFKRIKKRVIFDSGATQRFV